jgi:hypothetical protein
MGRFSEQRSGRQGDLGQMAVRDVAPLRFRQFVRFVPGKGRVYDRDRGANRRVCPRLQCTFFGQNN